MLGVIEKKEIKIMLESRDRFAAPSMDDVRRLTRLIAVFNALREVSPTIPASYAQAFLAVALNPGHGPGTYAQTLGLVQPVTSRTLLEIGKKTRKGGPGLGLVDSQSDAIDLRLTRYLLTTKGHNLMAKIMQIVERGEGKLMSDLLNYPYS